MHYLVGVGEEATRGLGVVEIHSNDLGCQTERSVEPGSVSERAHVSTVKVNLARPNTADVKPILSCTRNTHALLFS